MRSESCTFIWHPKVRTWYVRAGADTAASDAEESASVEGLSAGEGMVKLTR